MPKYYSKLPVFAVGPMQVGAAVAEDVGVCKGAGLALVDGRCKPSLSCDRSNGVRDDGQGACVSLLKPATPVTPEGQPCTTDQQCRSIAEENGLGNQSGVDHKCTGGKCVEVYVYGYY
jgi:hypothetical protein